MESGGFARLLTMLFSLKYASILAYTKSYIQQKAEAGRFPQLLMFTASYGQTLACQILQIYVQCAGVNAVNIQQMWYM